MAEEMWKDIKDYEGLYQVSSYGRVRSLDRIHTYVKHYAGKDVIATHHFKGRILSTGHSSGYLSVVLAKDGSTKTFLVHRLVAQAFIPNPENKPQVNHTNGDHQKNDVDNLEWSTEKENQQHAVKLGLHSRSHNKYKVKVKCVDTGDTFESMADAERWLNCPSGKISAAIIANQKVRGYTFVRC